MNPKIWTYTRHCLVGAILFFTACNGSSISPTPETMPSPTIRATQQIPTPSPTLSQPSPAPSITTSPALTSELTPKPGFTPSQNLTLELVASLGGATTAADVQGDFVYAGVGAELVILSKNEGHLTQLSSTKMPAIVEDVKVVGDYVYVAAGAKGLQVVNVSDVAAPREIGHCVIPGFAQALAVNQDRVYIASQNAGLHVVNIADPADPIVMGTFDLGASANDVTIVNDIAYVAASAWNGDSFVGRSGVAILDISRPDAIREIGFLDTAGSPAKQVVAEGDYLYAVTGWETEPGKANQVWIFDIREPETSAEVTSFETGQVVSNIAVRDTNIYVTVQICDYMGTGECGGWLAIFDVSDPIHPIELGGPGCSNCGWAGVAGSLSLSEDEVYIAAGSGGMRVYDATHPETIKLVSAWEYPVQGTIYDIAITGHYAFIAARSGGLKVIDIAEPHLPTQTGEITRSLYLPVSVAIKERFAYVADLNGLQIFDISNPSKPQFLNAVATSGLCYGVTITSNYAYISNVYHPRMQEAEFAGLQVLDISNPSASVEISSNHDSGGFRSDPVVRGDYLYTSGLEILSLADPTSPTLLSDLPVSRSEGDTAIVVADHYAYIAAGDQGLRIIDVANPTAPIEVGAFTPPSAWFSDIELVDNLAYIAGGDVYIVDVSDPHNLVSVAVFDTPGSANGVSVVGDYVYVADGNAGLAILRVIVKR